MEQPEKNEFPEEEEEEEKDPSNKKIRGPNKDYKEVGVPTFTAETKIEGDDHFREYRESNYKKEKQKLFDEFEDLKELLDKIDRYILALQILSESKNNLKNTRKELRKEERERRIERITGKKKEDDKINRLTKEYRRERDKILENERLVSKAKGEMEKKMMELTQEEKGRLKEFLKEYKKLQELKKFIDAPPEKNKEKAELN